MAADPCTELPATRVEVKLLESPIQFSDRYSFKSLKGMSNRYADAGVDVLGLTIGKAQVRASSRSTLRRDPSGQWECSTHQIHIEFGYQRKIDRPIPRQTVRHETCFKRVTPR